MSTSTSPTKEPEVVDVEDSLMPNEVDAYLVAEQKLGESKMRAEPSIGKEPGTMAGPGGAVIEVRAGSVPTTATASTKETRDLARQLDNQDKLAKKQNKLGNKAKHVGATSVQHNNRIPEGKYGLRRPGNTSSACTESTPRIPEGKYGLRRPGNRNSVSAGTESPGVPDTSTPPIPKGGFNYIKILRTPDEEIPPRSNADIPVDQEPLSPKPPNEMEEDYMVQATLVPESKLRLENELTDIPQAEIVDLEELRPKSTLICVPESKRAKKVCLGLTLFLVVLAASVIIIGLVVASNGKSPGLPTNAPSLAINPSVQPTATQYPTGPPTFHPTNPQPTQAPIPITSVEWFGNQFNISDTTEIDLWDQQLKGTIPTELGVLTALTKIRLDGNNLNGTIPTELGLLTNLTFLRFDGNDLVGTLPSEVGLLTALTRLTFGTNQLTGTIPTQLGLLIQLEGIWNAVNQLKGPIPTELGLLTALTTLILRSNQMTGTIPTELASLTDLQTLWLYNNNFEGSIPVPMCENSTLSSLITDCAPDPFPLNCSCGICECF